MGSFAPGGTFSSVRPVRIALTSRISQSISACASVSTAASALGHCATISALARSPVRCHNSSVMNGMNGCSITKIWSNAHPATARVSSSIAPLVSSMYQSQNWSQTK